MRRFIECLIPLTACNFKCSYCYVIQKGWRKDALSKFLYSPEHIGNALSQERLGGVSLISMTASGETFLAKELPFIAKELLKHGHFINITTNGTLTKRITEFLNITKGFHDHIHVSFSCHYTELKKYDLVDCFFDNICNVRKAGCSILLQINLTDEYVPYWEEIKKVSKEKVGAFPQVALTRKENGHSYSIHTQLMSEQEYLEKGREMNSPLFDFTYRFFNKKRCEFCYAGQWSATLNLCTGDMSACYGSGIRQNIFEDINRPIEWKPIGKHCEKVYCFNSSHFISQGVIPELLPLPSYGELRDRAEASWYTEPMKSFLYTQFEATNKPFSQIKMWKMEYCDKLAMNGQNIKSFFQKVKSLLKRFLYVIMTIFYQKKYDKR